MLASIHCAKVAKKSGTQVSILASISIWSHQDIFYPGKKKILVSWFVFPLHLKVLEN